MRNRQWTGSWLVSDQPCLDLQFRFHSTATIGRWLPAHSVSLLQLKSVQLVKVCFWKHFRWGSRIRTLIVNSLPALPSVQSVFSAFWWHLKNEHNKIIIKMLFMVYLNTYFTFICSLIQNLCNPVALSNIHCFSRHCCRVSVSLLTGTDSARPSWMTQRSMWQILQPLPSKRPYLNSSLQGIWN